MRRFKKWIAMLGAAVCVFALMAAPVYADTDGTELQVADASKLEIQLGTAWSGVEFQLRTDVGIYPNTIAVGEDGVLRLEIGGSSVYTLTCLNSAVAVPEANEAATEETSMPDGEIISAPEQSGIATEADPPSEETEMQTEREDANNIAGIPIMHIVLFGGGLLLAVGGLVAIHVVNRRREERDAYDDDYYEDDE